MVAILEWVQDFVKGMSFLWDFLTTPIDFDGALAPILELIGVETIIPLYLVVGSTCIVGLIRRLL